MKDYSVMSDFEISHAVAKAIGFNLPNSSSLLYNKTGKWELFDPCNNPVDGWPIIVENKLHITTEEDGVWSSRGYSINHVPIDVDDANPLRAAMVVYLMMKDAEKGHG